MLIWTGRRSPRSSRRAAIKDDLHSPPVGKTVRRFARARLFTSSLAVRGVDAQVEAFDAVGRETTVAGFSCGPREATDLSGLSLPTATS